MGTSSIKHGKVVPQSDDQMIKLLMKSSMTFKGINQHTQESHASHCDITHAKWYDSSFLPEDFHFADSLNLFCAVMSW